MAFLTPIWRASRLGAEAAVEAADAGAGLAEAGRCRRRSSCRRRGGGCGRRRRRSRRPPRRPASGVRRIWTCRSPTSSRPTPLLRDLVVADVAVVAADLLVAAGAEGLVAGAGEDDRADVEVVAGLGEGVAELGQGRRPEGVAALGPVDRDLRDPVGLLVEDVLVVAGALPLDRGVEVALGRGVLVSVGMRVEAFCGPASDRRQNGRATISARLPRPGLRTDATDPKRLARPQRPDPPGSPGAGRTTGSASPTPSCASGRERSPPRWSAAGAGPGDPVAIDLAGGLDHAVALHGAVLAGAVVQSLPRSGRRGRAGRPGLDPSSTTDLMERADERGRGVADHPPAAERAAHAGS